MPGMDGLTFLDKIMRLRPTPVIMISGLTQKSLEATLKALEFGAVDVVAKSNVNIDRSLIGKENEIIEKVRAAAQAKVGSARLPEPDEKSKTPRPTENKNYDAGAKVVVLGVSADGVEAIRYLLSGLPSDCPGMLIVQHMPAAYTGDFAARLDRISPIHVREAKNGDQIRPGTALIASGERHLELARSRSFFICKTTNGPPVFGHKPSVDVPFQSAARVAAKNTIGVILTGMGKDGAAGLLEMRQAGAPTIAQNEETCVVFGMPREAIAVGGAVEVVALDDIPSRLMALVAASGRAQRV